MAKVTAAELFELKIKHENGIKLTRDEKKILKDNDKEAIAKKKSMTFAERMQAATDPEMTQSLSNDNEVDEDESEGKEGKAKKQKNIDPNEVNALAKKTLHYDIKPGCGEIPGSNDA